MATYIVYKAAKSPGDSNLKDVSELSDVCKSTSEIKAVVPGSFAVYPFQGRQGGTHIVLWKLAASSLKLNCSVESNLEAVVSEWLNSV